MELDQIFLIIGICKPSNSPAAISASDRANIFFAFPALSSPVMITPANAPNITVAAKLSELTIQV